MKLKRFKEGIWINYPKSEEVRFKIRPSSFTATMELLQEVKEKKVIESPPDPKDSSKKGTQIVDDYRDGAFLWKMFDRALEAWEGIDPIPEGETEPLPPIEIKKLIYDNDAMREFIYETSRKFSTEEEKKQEEERKNS